ncbi:Uncharacterised protein [Streptococcus macacae NCTC 11558]|nr:Uncharacterised protein [Streptococcus macacae NCTC 11558]
MSTEIHPTPYVLQITEKNQRGQELWFQPRFDNSLYKAQIFMITDIKFYVCIFC